MKFNYLTLSILNGDVKDIGVQGLPNLCPHTLGWWVQSKLLCP